MRPNAAPPGRRATLASAHSLVKSHLNDVGRARRASDLETVLRAVLAPRDPALPGHSRRFSIGGPDIARGDHAINGQALILRELVTNAAKYGALSVDTGRVDVAWDRNGEFLELSWVEEGGPSVAQAPGSARTVTGQFGGHILR